MSAPEDSVEVQAFYDRYPYPPPIDDLEAYRQRWQDFERHRADYHLFWPAIRYREDLSILVAGCGTSQAARYAVRWPAAAVTGIDISATSIKCTEQLKRKHRLDNLEVRQLALERVIDLGARFDLVVCTGVVHHLSDPDAGLRALREVLAPQGAMHLMVYAPYGRSGIYMLQEFCRRVGLRAPNADYSDLLLALKALPTGHPLLALLHNAPDFQTEAALADMLLHPQDQAFSVPQLFALLNRNGLTFGRWLRQAQYSLQLGLMSRIPRTMRSPAIPAEDQAAAAEVFRGNITRHSAVAYRVDDREVPRIEFTGDAWLGYVPIRLPDTIAVREQLPAGIAAILINRAHTQPDICLPLSPNELPLFEAIDGRRKIGELLGTDAPMDAARSLFERLWLHDQVVFDTS
jgi:SAM-dependent methyltransferase